MNDRALNRALLSRQGLLDPIDAPLPDVLARIGAVQAQSWSAAAVALCSRVRGFTPDQLYAALTEGTLVTGLVHRGTVHLMAADEHPMYAGVLEASGRALPWRTTGDWVARAAALRPAVAAVGRGRTVTAADVEAAAEAWVADHPGVIPDEELAKQRAVRWRTLLRGGDFIRVPSSGRWNAKAPDAVTTARQPRLPADDALDRVVVAHLRAFGPAGADDIAAWTGARVPQVKAALARASAVVPVAAERPLYDVVGGAAPDENIDAPPRFLAAFDSVILAYAPKRRSRLVPEGTFERIYNRANLQIRPTFLVDGLVAGTWSLKVSGRRAALTATPFDRLTVTVRRHLRDEGDALVRALHPTATQLAIDVA